MPKVKAPQCGDVTIRDHYTALGYSGGRIHTSQMILVCVPQGTWTHDLHDAVIATRLDKTMTLSPQ